MSSENSAWNLLLADDLTNLLVAYLGFSFGLYFGVWTTINAAQMLFLWGAIMGLIQIYQGRGDSLALYR